MSSALRTLLVLLGAAVMILGGVLIARPFTATTTLATLAAAGLAAVAVGLLVGETRPWPTSVRLDAVSLLAVAAVLGSQRELAITEIALLVGAALLVDGLAVLVRSLGSLGTPGTSRAGLLFGPVGLLLGAAAIATPEPSVLIVAILLGLRVLWSGADLAWTGVRGTYDDAEPTERGSVQQFPRFLVPALVLALGVTAGAFSYWENEGKPTELGDLTLPSGTPPAPGTLIGAESFERGAPAGTRAWRILYSTTRDTGQPAYSTALVVVSDDASTTARPVLAWAHGTTGISERCAPSTNPSPLTFRAIPGFEEVIDRGWAVVATDYTGLGTPGPHPYLIGQGEGRSVLDSVRAARELKDLNLAAETLVWGHSQGGGAALWTGILAPTYAPEIDLVGAAGIAPATDLVALAENLARSPFGVLFGAYVLSAYSETYPDVDLDDYVRPASREAMAQLATFCTADVAALSDFARRNAAAFSGSIYTAAPSAGALGKRLRENIPDDPIAVPTFIAQGGQDQLVLPAAQDRYVELRCARPGNGAQQYRTYPDREHVNIIAADSAMVPELISWSEDRFAGLPASSTC